MADRGRLVVDDNFRDQLRGAFDAHEDWLGALYECLTWPQKAKLLDALVTAGDHPTGFRVLGSVRRDGGGA